MNFDKKMYTKSAYLLGALVRALFALDRLFEPFLKDIPNLFSLY